MSKRRVLGRLAGAAVGLAAVGAAAGGLAERRLSGRTRAPAEPGDLVGEEAPLGSLRGEVRTVTTPDGVDLHVEVDEVGPADDAGAANAATVVLVHGFSLNLDSWHYQRLALRGRHRLVLYDLRSHGRSSKAGRDSSTIEQLGRDLRQVLDSVVPEGRVVLVGHSMGGMVILALAQQDPDYVAARVAGVGLVATSAGDLGDVPLSLPGLPGRVARRLVPGTLAVVARAPWLAESGRRAGSQVAYRLTAHYAFGGEVDDELVEFVDDMLSATPVTVVADFFPSFSMHHRYGALSCLRDVPTLVVCGTHDLITPAQHSRQIASRLPSARLHELDDAGHMVLLEQPDEVNDAIEALLSEAAGEDGR